MNYPQPASLGWGFCRFVEPSCLKPPQFLDAGVEVELVSPRLRTLVPNAQDNTSTLFFADVPRVYILCHNNHQKVTFFEILNNCLTIGVLLLISMMIFQNLPILAPVQEVATVHMTFGLRHLSLMFAWTPMLYLASH